MGRLSNNLIPLLNQVAVARTFDQTADTTLRSLILAHDKAASQSLYRTGIVRRAIVHLRPQGGYRGLYAIARDTKGDYQEISNDPSLSSSSFAWLWLQRRGHSLSVDVALGTVSGLGAEPEPVGDPQLHGTERTLSRMRGRAASHLLVLPICFLTDTPEGMVLLECECKQAIGTTYLWPILLPLLEATVRVVSPYLCGLPVRPAEQGYTHPLLPVVGKLIGEQVRLLRVFAAQDEILLLSGATGTGKSRLARWCHAESARADGPFVTVDLNAVGGDMHKAELFGWKAGSFTGAVRNHVGAVARAQGGTLFLDEIDKLTLDLQAGLLRLLEEGRYQVLGDSSGPREADVRFIVGTNINLSQAVAEGRFLEDLYYRIDVLPFQLPPLSARVDEIVPWAEFMLRRRTELDENISDVELSTGAGQLLELQPWPGNLRHLDNICRRAYSIALAQWFGSSEPLTKLRINRSHVEAALRMGASSSASANPHELLTKMRQVAQHFATLAGERAARGESFDLDHLNALRGMVLEAAIEQTDDIAAAFVMLGREPLVRSRNHHRALKDATLKIAELQQLLGAYDI